MRQRLTFAALVLVAGFATIWAAVGTSAYSAANGKPRHTRGATPATERYLAATAKVERDGYVRRESGGRIKAKGWVSATHIDDRSGARAGGFRYDLHTSDGRILELKVKQPRRSGGDIDAQQMVYAPNSVVEVSGSAANGANAITVARSSVVGEIPSPGLTTTQTPRAASTRTIAVIRWNYANDRSEPASKTAIENTLFNQDRSLRDYYLRASTDEVTFTGEVFPYVELDLNRDPAACNEGAASTEALDKARAAGYPVDGFDHVAFVFDGPLLSCGNPSGELTGRYTYYPNSGESPDVRVFAHELGHNLGLNHANTAICSSRGIGVPMSDTCVEGEYFDQTDVMGTTSRLPTAFHKARLGFLPLENTREVTPAAPAAAQDIALTNVETRGAAQTTQLVRIRRSGTAPDVRDGQAYLYVDYRQPDGRWDNFAANDPVVRGVTVRLASSYGARTGTARAINASPGRRALDADNLGWGVGNERSARTDPTGRTTAAGRHDFALAPGQSLWDPEEDITITAVSASGPTAQIRVTTGGPPGASTTVGVFGGELLVNAGNERRNNVILSEYGGQYLVADMGNSVVPSVGCEQLDRQTVACSKTKVTSARVVLEDGDDLGAVFGNFTLPVTFDGGLGQDTLEGGPEDDTFLGGPGHGAGTPGSDADLFSGGGGKDTVSYGGRTAPVSATATGTDFADGTQGGTLAANEGDNIGGGIGNLIGGNGGDFLQPDPAVVQRIEGGPGVDRFRGGNLADTIVTRDGVAETDLNCGAGIDTLIRDTGTVVDAKPTSCDLSPTGPPVTITSGPAEGSETNVMQPAFAFSSVASTGITFQCKIEAGTVVGAAPYVACNGGSYVPTAIQPEGPAIFTVRGTLAGVTTTVSRRFKIDRVVPSTSIATRPAAVSEATAASFTFGSDIATGARFECKLDTAAYQSCPAAKTYASLLPGVHTFLVRAVDPAGNVDPSPEPASWTTTYDTILVSTPRDSMGRADYYDEAHPVFSFRATAPGATFACSFDGAPEEACTSPYRPTTPLTTWADHTFSVRAIAPGGLSDPTPATDTRSYLSQSLETLITSGPADGSTTNSPTFEFRGEYNNQPQQFRYECRVGTGAFAPCTSPYTVAAATGTNVTFAVRAVHFDGQRLGEDETPATRTFSVDTTPPNTVIDSGPAAGSTTTSLAPTFTFSSTEAGSTFRCSYDFAALEPCSSPLMRTWGAGSHTFMVVAIDAAGNMDGSAATRSFTVTGPPDTSITSGPASGSAVNIAQPTFAFTAAPSAGATFECSAGATAAWVACTSPWTVPAQVNGASVRFRVRATGPTGLVDLSPDSRIVTFDFTAPDTAIASGPAQGSTISTPTATFGFTSPESGVTFECRLDGGSWSACPATYTTPTLANGLRTLDVRARDAAGNPDTTVATRSFTVAQAQLLTVSPAAVTPSTVDLSTDPTLGAAVDWVHWIGPAATQLDRKAGTPVITSWTRYANNPGTVISVVDPATFSWTNAVGTASGSSKAGVAATGNGRGFTFTIPAVNTQTRKLKLFVGVRGATTTAALRVSFNGQTPITPQVTGNSSTVSLQRTFTIDYRPLSATDTLTVSWLQGGGPTASTSQAVLYGAAIY